MTQAPLSLPAFALDEPTPGLAERLVRWGLVAGLHAVLAYAVLHLSVQLDMVQLPQTISARLLLPQEIKKPEAPPPPPSPAKRKTVAQPQPILAARVPEAAPAFVVAPQPLVSAPVPIDAVVAPPAPPTPLAPIVAARFDADYLDNPKPVYPVFSRRSGEQGKVVLRVKVSAEGAAQELEVKQSSGFSRLDAAAREAVAKWRFVPAKRGNEAIVSWVMVPITFALD